MVLTTPNYNEIVTWTVFKTPVFVSERQVSSFGHLKNIGLRAIKIYILLQVAALRTIHDEGGNEIDENYRDVQAIDGRLILFNWRPSLWPFFNK